jgi:hypothetical protein
MLGALLLIVAGLFAVLLIPIITGSEHAEWDPWTARGEDCRPLSWRSLAGQCASDHWTRVVVLAIFAAALATTGLGTIRRQPWARYLGVALCIVGVILGTYIAFMAARSSYWQFTFDGSTIPFSPDAIETPMAPVANLFVTLTAGLFTLAFALAVAVYIWKWRARSTPHSSEQGLTNFTLVVGLLCVSAVGMLYAYQVTLNRDGWLWVAALAVIEALSVGWCIFRFRKEFGSVHPAIALTCPRIFGPSIS